ncbi:hypothetical protein [Aneurinibacillus tyrosinisolvens]|uniref:hypothetical protein n=1 Tax=Aneurinibacillus tyrosinisolvens TaxID=1443435 RepID=UPI00063FA945|nr:hypothetical protein [Aneurinibacillus tyrosinisolvens]
MHTSLDNKTFVPPASGWKKTKKRKAGWAFILKSSDLYYKGDYFVPPSNPLGERYVTTSFIVEGGR